MPGSAWLLAGLALAGFRGGDAVYATGALPTDDLLWSTPLRAWSNASPVVFGDMVCAPVEPVTLVCLEADTGKLRWSADHTVLDALPDAERGPIAAEVTAARAGETELVALHAEHSRLRRAATAGDANADASLDRTARRIFELQAMVASQARYLTPPDKELIGWSTPTPVADGRYLFALFGNGVVAAHDKRGAVVWQRWLGEPHTPMHGYPYGTTSSPLLVEGTLVLGYGSLLGLDPATGETRWTGPAWRALGTPTVATVGGQAVLVTPDGDLFGTDGTRLGKDLGDVYWSSPTAVGDAVYFAGSKGSPHTHATHNDVWSVRLVARDDRIVVEQRWHTRVVADSRVFATPVVHDDVLYVVTERGTLVWLETEHGDRLGVQKVSSYGAGHLPSPVVVGNRLLVGSESGQTSVLTLAPRPTIVAEHRGAPFRSTPMAHGKRLYVRTLDGLVAFGHR